MHPGDPRLLNGIHTAVGGYCDWLSELRLTIHRFMEAYIERSPDALLSELQDALWDIYEEDVSAQTVLRTLRWQGLTRKPDAVVAFIRLCTVA